MFQVAHLLGKALCILKCNLRAIVGRAIVHEQELHVIVGLGEDALDRLPDELFGVQEGDDAGNQWLVTHPISITRLFWRHGTDNVHRRSVRPPLAGQAAPFAPPRRIRPDRHRSRGRSAVKPLTKPSCKSVTVPVSHINTRQLEPIAGPPDDTGEGGANAAKAGSPHHIDRLRRIIVALAVRVRKTGHRMAQDLLQTSSTVRDLATLHSRRERGENWVGHRVGPDLDQPSLLQLAYLPGRERTMLRGALGRVDHPIAQLVELSLPLPLANRSQQITERNIETVARSRASIPGPPTTVASELIHGVISRFSQFPLVRVAVDAQRESVWHRPWPQQQPGQFVPPELTLAPDEPRSNEDGRGDVMTLEQRLGIVEVIGVTVIEGDDHRAVR